MAVCLGMRELAVGYIRKEGLQAISQVSCLDIVLRYRPNFYSRESLKHKI